jgi:predicted ferric reductase
VSARVRTLAGRGLALLALANAVVVVSLWLATGGPSDVHDLGGALTSAGRVAGLLGAYLVLVELLLLARIPLLERLYGFERLAVAHRINGRVALSLLLAHAALITAGYTVGDGISLLDELDRLITGYPGVITAIAGLTLLVAVVVTSAVAVRRRLRYETWHFLHLYAYLGVALAFSHQLATGTDFLARPVARAYWTALYVVTLGALVVFRILLPLARSLLVHRLRVERVIEEAPGVVSLEIGGERLHRLRAQAGQFFTWRFLTRDRWWEAHPFSLSAAPDGRRLRITVKGLGDYTASLAAIPPGTRVIAEGPFGSFTAAARRRPRVALIAGGVGITPIRALLEEMPGGPEDITVVYRALRDDDVILRSELDELAGRRGVEVHYLVGDHDAEPLSPERLRALMPDIATRDVYVCGPPAMVEATRATLGRSGVSRRHIVTERFAY